MQKKRRGGGRETAAWRRGRRDAATVVGRVGRGEVDQQRRPKLGRTGGGGNKCEGGGDVSG